MDATELQLRRHISVLEERLELLTQIVETQTEKIENIDDSINERIRVYLVGLGLIDGCAEDE